MIKNFFLPVLLLLLLNACEQPSEAPVFKRIDNVKVTKVTGSEAYLNANAYFYNPNDVKMKLKKVEVDVTVDGHSIGTINHKLSTKIPAKAEFKVPLDATFDMKQVGFFKSVFSILGGKKLKVHYKGFIRVKIYGFPVKVPVDYKDDVRL